MGRAILVALVAFGLSACATGYKSKGWSGGFSETQLSPDTFMVNFAANAYTSPEQASDFAILRAADKSQALGCDHFAILNGAARPAPNSRAPQSLPLSRQPQQESS